MTGPEHYREAERLMNGCKNSYDALVIEDGTAEVLAAAQVHATLALTASHALTQPVCSETEDGSGHATKADYDAWMQVAGGAA